MKEDENVIVGHIIAVIDDLGEASSSASSSPPAAKAQKQEAPPTISEEKKLPPPRAAASAPQMTASSDDSHGRGRIPSIQFPPRRTSTGDIISMMPAAEAAAAAAAATASAAASSSSSSSEVSKPVRMTESPHKSQLFIRVPPRSSGPDPPPRKELSEWEIENIMLGGAEMEI